MNTYLGIFLVLNDWLTVLLKKKNVILVTLQAFCLEDVWTKRSALLCTYVLQEKNPTHIFVTHLIWLIVWMHASMIPNLMFWIHSGRKIITKFSAKRVNYKIERLIVYHGTQIHHTHKDQMDFLTLKPPPWLSFRFCSQFLMDNPMLWSKCLISFVCKE